MGLGYDGQLGHVQERLEAATHKIRHGRLGRVRTLEHLRDVQPLGQRVRCPMLVERLAVHAVGKAFHHERAIRHDRQCVRRHLQIEANELTLGDAHVRPEYLVEITDGYA